MHHSAKKCRAFIHPEWMTILVLLASSTAFCLPLLRRLELSLLWLPLFVIAFVAGIVLLIAVVGMLTVRVSDTLDERRRMRLRRRGFAGNELLIVIFIFGMTIALLLPPAQALAQRYELSSWYVPIIFVGLVSGLIGIFYVFGKVSRFIHRLLRQRARRP